MESFDNINFKGVFRGYQQKVLDNSSKYLFDKKINIVAAPGSGKTVLGIELIRRLNRPCLILSPTTTIRGQWGMRFKEMFLGPNYNINDFVSYDLNNIKLINSITYQALYSAMNKIEASTEDEIVDYSNIELFKIIDQNNIGTICLDEAHHLQNEWQKALERFINRLSKKVTIISLTATPPYDSKSAEWNRYIEICGEIDDEIFVPELVKENTLCPHQDYIYFNYPTLKEIDLLSDYKEKSYNALNEISQLTCMSEICEKINHTYLKNYDFLFNNAGSLVAVICYLQKYGYNINKKLIHILTRKKHLPSFNLHYAELAIQFMIDVLCDDTSKGIITKLLREKGLIEKKKVQFDLNEKLKRRLISSMGKLDSIKSIAEAEYKSLSNSLRMLILTDYIKKDSINLIGTEKKLEEISVVSIFEILRKNNITQIGVLSGSLIILPVNIIDNINKIDPNVRFNYRVLNSTEFCELTIIGNNKLKVEIVSKLFEQGYINILIGTKSLLGEGWDSPCINSLILASFISSFVSSNQMRGRAIRIDKNNPKKVANIWHLVTLEPEYIFKDNNINQFFSYINDYHRSFDSVDFDSVESRFDCFVGPNYSTGEIESGIGRIDIIRPPYTKKNFEQINNEMIKKSLDRSNVSLQWKLNNNMNGKLFIVNEISKEYKVPVFTFYNMLGLTVGAFIQITITTILSNFLSRSYLANSLAHIIIILVATMIILFFMKKIIFHIIRNFSATKSIKNLASAVLRTLKDIDLIQSNCSVKVKVDDLNVLISTTLVNGTVREQNIFNTAIKELLSPIENPRYLIIKKAMIKLYDYKISFACPSVIGQKKEYVELFLDELKMDLGKMDIIYTRNEDGRKMILKCRKKSFITFNAKTINTKQKISNWD